uniref:Uncharacterized protein n=1 Tax=Anguilla anguilla TaxID=7936 RepID=A0A0E9QGV5_ANGAN
MVGKQDPWVRCTVTLHFTIALLLKQLSLHRTELRNLIVTGFLVDWITHLGCIVPQ